MSTCVSDKMNNNHELTFLAGLGQTLHLWGDRWRQRRELSHRTERDLHDVGLSWSDVVREVEKPFWRA
jgi:uncharacterized protein YjiS (DUF1127 family)